MKQFKIGQIVSVVGLKGELKVFPYTDYKERFEELQELYIEDKMHQIEKVRYNGKIVILKIKGIDDRTTAESMRGKLLLIDRKNARTLPEDTYFISDLIGLKAINEDGELLGELTDVVQNPAQDLYEITFPDGKKILVPAVEEFVLEINLKSSIIKLHLIEGLA